MNVEASTGARLAVVVATVLVCGPANSQTIDAATALAGWRAGVERATRLAPYVLTGERQIPGMPTGKITWRSLIGGGRYHVTWQSTIVPMAAVGGPNPPGPYQEKTEQSFDGTLWYGLTTSRNIKSGIICKHPEQSVEADLDAELAKKAAGGFFVRLSDVLERPVNINGKSILQGYEELERYISASTHGDRVTLTLGRKRALQNVLPSQVVLKMFGNVFCPTAVMLAAQASGYSSRDETFLSNYAQIGNGFYPRNISETTRSWRGSKDLGRSRSAEYRLYAAPVPRPEVRSFQIIFPPGTSVMDDRQTGPSRLQKVPSAWEPGRAFLPWASIAAVVIVGCWVLGRAIRHRKASA